MKIIMDDGQDLFPYVNDLYQFALKGMIVTEKIKEIVNAIKSLIKNAHLEDRMTRSHITAL